tara:strand:+ start:496 stop:1689 length:1194 start_codon:yes stop_codon:yes gene_type:complete
MPLYKFQKNDIFYNRLKANPFYEFLVYDGAIYFNNADEARFNSNTPVGGINLYELNVNRDGSARPKIYPFITKDGTLSAFKTVSTTQFWDSSQFTYGSVISGNYPLTATISSYRYPGYTGDMPIPTSSTAYRPHLEALQNTLNYYVKNSIHHQYSASLGEYVWNKASQEVRLISIPSIFFGSSIKKGSVNLKFMYSGSLIGELKDEGRTGDLIQVGPEGSTGSGSVAGVVLYNEGFLVLTGSWDMSGGTITDEYLLTGDALTPQWKYFAHTGSSAQLTGSSFYLTYEGTRFIPTMTMFAHAKKGHLNHSNNPTFIAYDENKTNESGTFLWAQPEESSVKNVVKSVYDNVTASFQRETYISKIGIYDEKRNLIGVAKLAKPLRKTEDREFTFKIKLDI